MLARIVAIGLAGASAATAAAPPAPVYTVARIGSALDEAEPVGARRAGLMCLPAGRIRWGDVVSGTQMDQREVVQDAIEDAGIAVTPLGIGSEGAVRLRATVTAASFSLCARHWGIAGSTALSGAATMRVEWRLEGGSAGRPVTHVSEVTHPVAAAQAAPIGAIYRRMLVDAARDAAAWLKAD